MKIVLIISSLAAGGAERVMSIIANYWARKGWDIILLTFDDGSEPPFYNLDPKINHQPLNLAGKSHNMLEVIWNNFHRVRVIRKAIKKYSPQAVVAFMIRTNILTLIALLGLKIPSIVCEHIHPNFYSQDKIGLFMRNLIYPKASQLTVLTHAVLSCLPPRVRRKAVVIPNPVKLPVSNNDGREEKTKNKILLAMGRLNEQKGFDLLLKAFAPISPKFPDWSLHIWGEGTLRKSLEDLRDQLGLHDRVHLPGLTKSPHEKMQQAGLFVISSRLEGFPMVLVEAMSCGLPVLGFACPGIKDIIRDGLDGLLVPQEDVTALSKALERLMSNEEERNRLAKKAPEVVERFGLEKVMRMWEKLIFEVVE